MRTSLRKWLAAAVVSLGIAGAMVTPAQADPIAAGQWYAFGFGGTGSSLVSGVGFGQCQLCIPAPNAPWTFTLSGPTTFILTDGFRAGDNFELFDFGVSIGSTPAVAPDGDNCGNDQTACLGSALISHSSFLLGAGNHSITGNVLTSPFGGGAGFFILRAATQVPEPGSLALLAIALVSFAFVRARRSV